MTFPPIGPPQGVPVPVIAGRHDVLDTPEISPTLITFYAPGTKNEFGVSTTSAYSPPKSFEFRTSADGERGPTYAGFRDPNNWVDLMMSYFRTYSAATGAGTNVSITRLTGVVTYKSEWTSTACRLYQNGTVIATITTNIPSVALGLYLYGYSVAFDIDQVSIT